MRSLAALVAAAPVTVMIVLGADASARIAGHNLLWPDHSRSLPDAVALQDSGEMALRLGYGADPNRPELVSRSTWPVARLTPLEAAVLAHRADLFQLLVQAGAVLDADTVRTLRCFAEANGAHDIAEDLAHGAPLPDCRTVRTPW